MVKWCSAQCLRRIHEFGLELPKMVKEAIAINKKDGNTIWQVSIENKMENVKITFQVIKDGERPPNSYHATWYWH